MAANMLPITLTGCQLGAAGSLGAAGQLGPANWGRPASERMFWGHVNANTPAPKGMSCWTGMGGWRQGVGSGGSAHGCSSDGPRLKLARPSARLLHAPHHDDGPVLFALLCLLIPQLVLTVALLCLLPQLALSLIDNLRQVACALLHLIEGESIKDGSIKDGNTRDALQVGSSSTACVRLAAHTPPA